MKTIPIYLVIGLCLLATACEPALIPELPTGDPVFQVAGSLDDTPFTLTAGKDGYYMKTAYTLGDDAVYTFRGDLAPTGCTDCPASLGFRIRNTRTGTEAVDPEGVFKTGTYTWFAPELADITYRVSFQNESSDTTQVAYLWDFGDGTTDQQLNPVHYYTDSTAPGGRVDVCLQATDPDGCATGICNEINLVGVGCQADFTFQVTPGTQFVRFTSLSQGKFPWRYRWRFGDGHGATLGNPGYTYATRGRYRACLTILDAEGCESTMCKDVSADPDMCRHNFSWEVEKTQTNDPLGLGQVEVVWTDAEGRVFSSARGKQPGSSRWEVLQARLYEPNEKGEKTIRLEVRFTATLFAEDGAQVVIRDASGTVALAYP
ncbi:MAG: PKD domain-containing protein [Bacteroidia bacterium]|nr:PKD domain-containing protein [Bacteroidia bacterium]